ncbi:MAG: hypothetical protein L3J52_02180, partial [Proteobacteria bacterium]|nr:hypothetical protein [Pseudomonadota bacterium]
MRKILVSFFALMVVGNVFAELPSWGLTKQQFESSIAISKLEEIGKTAVQKNYKLSITAPMDWHTKIRNIFTVHGKLEVQMTFKDSLYESVSLVAEKGVKQIRATASNNSNGHGSKQGLIDKPDIDADVEGPNFDNKKYGMGEKILLRDC